MKKIISIIFFVVVLMFGGCSAQSVEKASSQTSSISTKNVITTQSNENVDKSHSSSGDLKAHYIDVGQGDSIFIELPNKETMLIDAGESDQAQTVITYIHNQGYDEINYLVSTHPHSDHIGGMSEVIDNFIVDNVYLSIAPHTTQTYERLLQSIKSSGAKCYKGISGTNIVSYNSFSAAIMGPNENFDYGDNLNNASVVIKIKNGDNTFLFTGDAEKEEIETLSNLNCDVLKLGHHGSGTATTYDILSEISPKYGIISVGVNNQYGHPHQNVIDLLNQFNVKTYRTDEQGTVVVTSDGKNISVNVNPTNNISNNTTSVVPEQNEYVLNTNTKKIHKPNCSSVARMSEKNKQVITDYDKAIQDGYSPCQQCNP